MHHEWVTTAQGLEAPQLLAVCTRRDHVRPGVVSCRAIRMDFNNAGVALTEVVLFTFGLVE